MPVQTQKKANVFFPDGAKVSVKCKGDSEWWDVGAINSTVTATLNWSESVIESANAGTLDTKISNMEIAGGFTLINLNPVGVGKMSGGALNLVETAAGASVTFDDQEIAPVALGTWYNMVLEDEGIPYSLPATTAKPVLTSIKDGDTTLVDGTDYTIIKDDEGYKISFVAAHDSVTIKYGANTVIKSRALQAGSSSVILKPYAMKIDHVDDNGDHRTLFLYAVYSNSGGFQFNFKGANEDGVEEMPIAFTARLDTSRTNGKQLFTWALGDVTDETAQ